MDTDGYISICTLMLQEIEVLLLESCKMVENFISFNKDIETKKSRLVQLKFKFKFKHKHRRWGFRVSL